MALGRTLRPTVLRLLHQARQLGTPMLPPLAWAPRQHRLPHVYCKCTAAACPSDLVLHIPGSCVRLSPGTWVACACVGPAAPAATSVLEYRCSLGELRWIMHATIRGLGVARKCFVRRMCQERLGPQESPFVAQLLTRVGASRTEAMRVILRISTHGRRSGGHSRQGWLE